VDMSDLPAEYARSAPTLGEHTHEILTELGYSEEAIKQLRDQAVV
jgi:crotonobetainyl-CoA:carnitine CoA-transferase CaiB-like acyl-CoA transferase